MNDNYRRTGRTSRIVSNAPPRAWFLVPDDMRVYAVQALQENGRTDMTVVTVSDVLNRHVVRGKNIPAAVKDHTITGRFDDREAWIQLKSRVRPQGEGGRIQPLQPGGAMSDETHHFDEEKREAQRRATREVNSRLEKPLIRSKWRHKGTGNEYRVESLSHGSGELHGHFVVHYRRTNTDTQLFSRLLLEWDDKMERMS